jgi:large subunit ribosomal protein L23
MSLFSRSEKTDTEKAKTAVADTKTAAKTPSGAMSIDRDLTRVIEGLRITEKSVKLGDNNVYTFKVRLDATKYQIRDAVIALYSVTPVKVNTVNKKPAKRLSGSKNRMVKVPGMKKAYVYLKKGDSINLV